MATQVDKEGNLPRADPTSTRNTAKETEVKPVEGKDPDVYDPMGMAGKQAGIVQEIGQQLVSEGTNATKEAHVASQGIKGDATSSAPKKEQA